MTTTATSSSAPSQTPNALQAHSFLDETFIPGDEEYPLYEADHRFRIRTLEQGEEPKRMWDLDVNLVADIQKVLSSPRGAEIPNTYRALLLEALTEMRRWGRLFSRTRAVATEALYDLEHFWGALGKDCCYDHLPSKPKLIADQFLEVWNASIECDDHKQPNIFTLLYGFRQVAWPEPIEEALITRVANSKIVPLNQRRAARLVSLMATNICQKVDVHDFPKLSRAFEAFLLALLGKCRPKLP